MKKLVSDIDHDSQFPFAVLHDDPDEGSVVVRRFHSLSSAVTRASLTPVRKAETEFFVVRTCSTGEHQRVA